MLNTKTLLRDIGLALYGIGWEAEIALRRRVDVRIVRRWFVGTSSIPEDVWPQLRDEILKRKLDLEELLDRLPR